MLDVGSGSPEELRVIAEDADRAVALHVRDTADAFRASAVDRVAVRRGEEVVVVHDPRHAIGTSLADRAHAVLRVKERIELRGRESLALASRRAWVQPRHRPLRSLTSNHQCAISIADILEKWAFTAG
ncbi:MAG TPA: hypothetical protein VID26_01330, partial [Candidatus Limnocylindrales bacterium]